MPLSFFLSAYRDALRVHEELMGQSEQLRVEEERRNTGAPREGSKVDGGNLTSDDPSTASALPGAQGPTAMDTEDPLEAAAKVTHHETYAQRLHRAFTGCGKLSKDVRYLASEFHSSPQGWILLGALFSIAQLFGTFMKAMTGNDDEHVNVSGFKHKEYIQSYIYI